MSEFKNTMTDLETMGRRAGCAILSIGAVEFDPKLGLGREYYRVVSLKSCESVGLHLDQETAAWWAKQSPEARKVLDEANAQDAMPIQEALAEFNEFLATGTKVWGNGADFDNAILIAAYAATGIQQGWGPYNGRCYRTLKSFFPQIKAKRGGVHHNALDDAKTQAAHAIEIAQVAPFSW